MAVEQPFAEDFNLINQKRRIPAISHVRWAVPSDLPEMEGWVNEFTYALYGDIDVSYLLTKMLITLCVENEDGAIVAAIFLGDHPNLPSIPPWAWSEWLYNLYRLELNNPRNTFWVHLTIWNEDYTLTFLQPLLQYIFASNACKEYVMFVVPPKVQDLTWLMPHGTRILPSGFNEPNKVQTLCLIVRQHFVTRYRIRRAVEEDNDDLVPLLHNNQKRLVQYYGEYYISELLTRHANSGRHIIVAEYQDSAVAMLCLNEAVNIDSLNESFELVPFYGLKKPHPDDVIMPEWTPLADELLVEEEEECELLPIVERPADYKFDYESVVSPESEEVEIEITHTISEESIDQFTILNVSSVHLAIDRSRPLDIRSSESTFSALVLSFTDYEMHLYSCKGILKDSMEELAQIPSKLGRREEYSKLIPTFCGETNAFALELAAAYPEHERESLALLLQAAFECFPGRDYCVLCIPSTCPPFPLMSHFTRVAPRFCGTYPQELYVLHRNAVSSHMWVRPARSKDVDALEKLLATLLRAPLIMSCFIKAVNGNENHKAFVLLSENQIVGAGIAREEQDMEYLKTHYNLMSEVSEDVHKSGSHGFLEHVVLAPMFQRHSRFFLREIHRLTDYSVLYYRIYSDEIISLQKECSISCVVQDLIAIEARQMTEYTQTNFEGHEWTEGIQQEETPFALYLSTARLLSLPRYEINAKVVVVGGSDTAIAFLDSLLRTKSATYNALFTNVTVVSPHGLPYQKPTNKARDIMFPRTTDFDYTYMHLTSLRTYVNVVHGVMTGIDRKLKYVTINNINFLSYDLLFILCGQQFQKPPVQKKQTSSFPLNVFLVNTETDASNALQKLQELTTFSKKGTYTIVVYGRALEAYCCLATLLRYGIAGTNIIFVEPFPPTAENNFEHAVSQFNDGEVDEAALNAIHMEGIKMYKSYYFVDWVIDPITKHVISVKFESRSRKINIECIAMFMYNDKTVSRRTFLAINQAGLVFDGALVIKTNCQTNDPNIYAAGPITKYSRKYYADDLAHRYFNCEEIGYTLGQQIRDKLIPADTVAPDDNLKCDHLSMLVPTFKKPLMTYCELPGELHYFKISKPGKQVPQEVAMSDADYGQVFVTGDINKLDDQGYFRLHLNQHGVVETVTCLAKFEIDYKSLREIWGKHEKLFNNLRMRFEMALIGDLFDYFHEPWCCAIYHDRFHRMQDKIYDTLTSLTAVPGQSLIEDIIQLFKENDWRKLSHEQEEEIEEKFLNSPYYKLLEQQVVEFLRNNSDLLPMYAHPQLVDALTRGCEASPYFEQQ